jgi:sulfide:quinone oxidoreductase
MAEPPPRKRVLVAGGGFAGLEATLALHHLAGDLVDVALLAPDPEFVYRPLLVEEPFTQRPPERRELAPILRQLGWRYARDGLARVDVDAHTVETTAGQTLPYDALVVCVGARARPAYQRATTLTEHMIEAPSVDELLRGGPDQGRDRIAFVVPPGVTWSLPAYELALLARRRADDLGVDPELVVLTPEDAPLSIFGPLASATVERLLVARRIETHCNVHVVEEADGFHVVPERTRLEARAVIALPHLEGPAVPGLPADESGFIPIDDHARVPDAPDVYAAGDGTTFPVKQGGIATQQADAAAEHIAASAGADIEPKPFEPVLRGKLFTGSESINLRQKLTGGAGEGEASYDYLWWPPHKVAGRYLPAFLGLATAPPSPDIDPSSLLVDVEVSFPHTWHAEPGGPKRGPRYTR